MRTAVAANSLSRMSSASHQQHSQQHKQGRHDHGHGQHTMQPALRKGCPGERLKRGQEKSQRRGRPPQRRGDSGWHETRRLALISQKAATVRQPLIRGQATSALVRTGRTNMCLANVKLLSVVPAHAEWRDQHDVDEQTRHAEEPADRRHLVVLQLNRPVTRQECGRARWQPAGTPRRTRIPSGTARISATGWLELELCMRSRPPRPLPASGRLGPERFRRARGPFARRFRRRGRRRPVSGRPGGRR